MSSPRVRSLALAVALAGCAGSSRAARDHALPPPATESRAGTREAGAGPAPGSTRRAQARLAPAASAGPESARPERSRGEPLAKRAVAAAEALVGRREIVVAGVRYGDGCAALVRAAFAAAGAPLPASATDAPALLALARARAPLRRGRPAPGDLAFLADRPGGPAEHVGLVASVGADGTALVLHHTERGVVRIHVNAAHPWKARADGGKALNDVVLVGGGRVTAGRLLVGWATLP